MNSVIVYLLKYWNGNLPLGKAFLFVFLPVSILGVIIKELLGSVASTESIALVLMPTIAMIFSGFYRAVGLWRCTKNSDSRPSIIGAKVVATYVFVMTLIASSIILWALLKTVF